MVSLRRRRLAGPAVVGLAFSLLLAACGGGGSGGSAAPASTAQQGKQALAEAVRIDSGVDVRLTGTDFTAVGDPVPVNVGDVVRTDDSGFAEIAYHDGSRTRLDVNTEFEVLALSDQPGEAAARTRMGVGRTWNRIKKTAAGDDAFSVETSVATATVRGTAFLIDCPDRTSCTFTVVEGAIEIRTPDGAITLLEAPATLTVADGVASPPSPVDVAAVLADPWVTRNANRDATAGFPGPGELSGSPTTLPSSLPAAPALPFVNGGSGDPGVDRASLILESSETSGGTKITLTVTNCPDTNAVIPGKPLDGVIWPQRGAKEVDNGTIFTPFQAAGSNAIPFQVISGGTFFTDVMFGPDLFGSGTPLTAGTYTFELICDSPSHDGTTQSVVTYFDYVPPGAVSLGS